MPTSTQIPILSFIQPFVYESKKDGFHTFHLPSLDSCEQSSLVKMRRKRKGCSGNRIQDKFLGYRNLISKLFACLLAGEPLPLQYYLGQFISHTFPNNSIMDSAGWNCCSGIFFNKLKGKRYGIFRVLSYPKEMPPRITEDFKF